MSDFHLRRGGQSDKEALITRLDIIYGLAAQLLQRPHSQTEIDLVAHRLIDAAGIPSWLPGSSNSRAFNILKHYDPRIKK